MFRQTLLLCCMLMMLIACKSEPNPVATAVAPAQEMVETAVLPATETPISNIMQVLVGGMIQDQVELGIIHPDRPLVIEFDQPLLKFSAPIPLQFDPPVAGSFTWNDEGTRLTFTPENGFAAGEGYQITQSPKLLTQSGLPFADQLVWQISTLSALNMASSDTQQSEPISEDEWLITFPIDFAREVDWQTVEEEFLVEPAVPLQISWWEDGRLQQKDLPDDDGRTVNQALESPPAENQMVVQARIPLDFDQTYRFVLQEWIIDCTCKRVLRDGFEREFALPALRAEVVHTDIVPQFRFNYRLDLENLESAAVLSPSFETEWHAEWDGYETVLTMDPNNLLPNKILYDFGFNEPVYHENGALLSPPARMTSFPTPFVIADEYPGREDWIAFNPFANIAITFTHRMDEQSVMDAFQIEPEVPGTFAWEENRLSFQPEAGLLDAWSQYTITLGTAARDGLGRPILPEPYTWQFTTSELPTDADFGLGTKVQTVDANGGRVVQYRSYPQEPINVMFGLYALSQEDVLQFLRGEQIDGEMGREVRWWTAVTEPKENDNDRYASFQETQIPSDIPSGPHLLTLDTGEFHDELLVFISENAVVVKDAGSQITVWTTKINGEIAGNLDVMVVDENGEVVANGRSSNEGIFQTELTEDVQPAFVFVQDGNDFAVTGLSGDWHTLVEDSGHYFTQLQQPVKTIVHLQTDRPLYRPNETVYFKGILRQNEDVQLKPFPEGSLVTVQLKSPDDELLDALELATNDFGTVHGQFQLPDTAVSGDYQIEMITVDGHETSQIFKVDAYQSGNVEVTVSTDAEFYLEDETILVTVDSHYLTGEPVANADVEVNLHVTNGERWDRWSRPSETITGTTDINGRFITAFEMSWSNPRTIEAIVDDGNGQITKGHKSVQVFSTLEFHQLDIGAYHKELGEPITGIVTVWDNFGEPVAGREIMFDPINYGSDSQDLKTIQLEPGLTDENGRYVFTFTLPELGYHHVKAWIIDPSGYWLAQDESFIVYSESDYDPVLFGYYGDDQLRFVNTGEVYKSGESVKLFIQSAIAGPALLTIERDGVYSHQIVDLTPPLTVVDVPIAANGAPNLFATIIAWKPYEPPEWSRGAINVPEYQLLASEVNIPIATNPHILNVEVLSDGTSGKETDVTLRVTDYKGDPVSAELSMAVIDEAIFELSPDFSKPMLDTFYFQRTNQVKNFDAMNTERYLWYSVENLVGDHSGMSYYGLFENYRNMDYSSASLWNGPHGEFAETAVWYPTLRTDENGEVTVSFILPEVQADWQIQVKAITIDSQVGEAVYSFKAE